MNTSLNQRLKDFSQCALVNGFRAGFRLRLGGGSGSPAGAALSELDLQTWILL